MNASRIVAVAGGSGSGKTTLAHDLCRVAGVDHAQVLPFDCYYRDRLFTGKSNMNFDHPDALESELLQIHLDALRRGNPVDVPVYDFASHRRCSRETTRIQPTGIVIVEGILALHYPDLRAMYSYSIYVDTDDGLRFARRRDRDMRERGRTEESIRSQWDETVAPMYEKFCAPTRAYASEVVRGESWDDEMVSALWNRIVDAVEVINA